MTVITTWRASVLASRRTAWQPSNVPRQDANPGIETGCETE